MWVVGLQACGVGGPFRRGAAGLAHSCPGSQVRMTPSKGYFASLKHTGSDMRFAYSCGLSCQLLWDIATCSMKHVVYFLRRPSYAQRKNVHFPVPSFDQDKTMFEHSVWPAARFSLCASSNMQKWTWPCLGACRHRAYMERNSLEGRVKQASNKQKGSARSSSSVEDESLVYSEPYREPNEDIQNLAEQNSFDGPSSPFSKWLQLGQPPDPASLQPKLNKIGEKSLLKIHLSVLTHYSSRWQWDTAKCHPLLSWNWLPQWTRLQPVCYLKTGIGSTIQACYVCVT